MSSLRAALLILTLAGSLSAALPARADRAAGDNCAKGLSPISQMIYEASAPDITKESTISEVVRAHTKQLVIDGKIARPDAKPAAEQAATCLIAIKQ